MKIQVRQSIYSSVAFGVVFIIISCLIYLLYADKAKQVVSENLERTAQLVGLFYLEEDELTSREFEKIKKQFEEVVSETSYQLYDDSDTILFGNKNDIVNKSILFEIQEKRSLFFSTDNNYCYGLFYEDNQGDFIIVTKESKTFLNEQLTDLLWILVSAWVIGLVMVILLSRWLSRIAYKPVSNVIEQVNNFSFENPEGKIKSPETKDELQELTETFNNLLDRISETIVIQKNFVNYVSHEFKTPLTSILGNLEVFSLKDRSPVEYEGLSQRLISQIHQLQEILDTLIIISDLRKESPITASVRIDELIWEIIEKVSQSYAKSKINVRIDVLPEEESVLTVHKDKTLLLMSLYNIIENAVKYSESPIEIRIFKESEHLNLSIQDKGIGIPDEELINISKPFYRANNTNRIQGNGIGLSIAFRILENNNIKYTIDSEVNVGTNIIICFE